MLEETSSTSENSRTFDSPVTGINFTALALATLESLLTVALVGGVILLCLGVGERLESTLWLISPIVGVSVGILRYRTYHQWRSAKIFTQPMTCITYLALGAAIFAIRLYFPQSWSVPLLLATFVIALLSLNAPRLAVIKLRSPLVFTSSQRSVLQTILQTASVILGSILTIAAFWPSAFTAELVSRALVLGGFGTILCAFAIKLKVSRTRHLIARIVIAVVVALAVWDFSRDFDIHHLGFYLAPTNEVQHGRLMLVDTFSQYGVGVFYVLAILLKILGLGYGSMALLTAFLTSLTTVVIFAILAQTTRSTFYSAIGIFIVAIVGPLASEGSVTSYPSTGFLRFGPTWLLILSLTITLKQDKPSRLWITISSLVLAFSIVWSFESAFYSLGTFVAVGVIGMGVIGEKSLASQLVRCAISAIVVIGLTGILLTLIFGRHSLSLITYMKYIKLYSLDGLGTLPVEPWSPGILVFMGAIASLVVLAITIRTTTLSSVPIRRELFPILAVTVYAILAFTYYLGRSHPNNLTHISAPFVVMITMWLSYLGSFERFKNTLVRIVVISISLFGLAIILLSNWPKLETKLPNSALASVSPSTTSSFIERAEWLLSNPVVDSRYEQIESLLEKYVPSETPVLIVVDANLMTETLIRLKKVNLITLSNPEGESLLSSEIRRITDQIITISCNSHLLLQHSDFRKNDAQETLVTIVALIRQHFNLVLLTEDDEFGLYKMRCT